MSRGSAKAGKGGDMAQTLTPLTLAAPGVAVVRNEDAPLLRGEGRYLPDLEGDHLHAVFVRSSVASAALVSIDAKAALDADGVVAVFTAGDSPPSPPTAPASAGAAPHSPP